MGLILPGFSDCGRTTDTAQEKRIYVNFHCKYKKDAGPICSSRLTLWTFTFNCGKKPP